MLEANSDLPPAPLALPLPTFVLVRTTLSPRRLDAWALALTVKGVPPVVRWLDGVGELYVLERHLGLASAELDAIDQEEREAQRARAADAALARRPVSKHATFGAVVLSLLLLGFFAVTGPRAGGSAWFSAGASDAELVMHGEWWRAVTALTLHADSAHVLSNVAIGTLVIGGVMRTEGVGWGAALVVAAGTVGNLINAWAHQSLHSSVGFSTAVFGAIGLLGGIGFMRSRRYAKPLRPAWTALAGTLAMLALLGTSEKKTVDMLAHLFGAFAGVGFGLLSEWRSLQPRTALMQWASGLGAASAVVGAWWLAFQ